MDKNSFALYGKVKYNGQAQTLIGFSILPLVFLVSFFWACCLFPFFWGFSGLFPEDFFFRESS